MNFKGGISKSGEGYLMIHLKNHPMAGHNGYVYLHRLIYAEYIGRNLKSDEIIHHKNGNKLDNRIENLQLVNMSQHRTIHNLTKIYKHKANPTIIKGLYLNGYSGRQIASILNIGKSTVLSCIKESGLSRSNMSFRDNQGKFIIRKEVC